MTSRGKRTTEVPHDDDLDAEIDWLLYLYGREAVKDAVKRRGKSREGDNSSYSKMAIEEIEVQIIRLLSSQSTIRIPTQTSIVRGALQNVDDQLKEAVETGLKRFLRGRTAIILLAAIDRHGSTGPYSHVRFSAALEQYLKTKIDDIDARMARQHIARIDRAKKDYERHLYETPLDDLSLRAIQDAIPASFAVRRTS